MQTSFWLQVQFYCKILQKTRNKKDEQFLIRYGEKKNVFPIFPRDVKRAVDNIYTIQNLHIANSVDLDQPTHPRNLIWFCISHPGIIHV